MELTPRLQAVACLVPRGARFADVGTDHGLLPVWLLKKGVIDYAIASDLRPGPLDAARRTAARFGVAERMSFRLCNGLSKVYPEETDVIVIAGMGGETIANILAASPWTVERGPLLLLQPQSAFAELRAFLAQGGYRISQEKIAREGTRLYTILEVRAGREDPLSPGELWAGKQSRDPLRGDYLDYMAAKVRRALTGHQAAARPDTAAIADLQEVLTDLLEMKGEWLSWQ